jgi:hypothetical protein
MQEVWPNIRRRLAAILQTIIVAPIYFAIRLLTCSAEGEGQEGDPGARARAVTRGSIYKRLPGPASTRPLSLHRTEADVWPIGDGHLFGATYRNGGDVPLPQLFDSLQIADHHPVGPIEERHELLAEPSDPVFDRETIRAPMPLRAISVKASSPKNSCSMRTAKSSVQPCTWRAS